MLGHGGVTQQPHEQGVVAASPGDDLDDLRLQPGREAEEREQALVSRKNVSSTIRPSSISSTCSAQGSYPPSGLGLYCPNAGEPFADPAGTTREPLQPIPGPHHQVKMSSRPVSHSENGGIDWVASSWMSEVSASMS